MGKAKVNSRINTRDLSTALFEMQPTEEVVDDTPEPKVRQYVYTMIGKEDYINAEGYPVLRNWKDKQGKTIKAEYSNKAYAKRVGQGRRTKYYVRQQKDGNLYNPIGLYSETFQAQKNHQDDTSLIKGRTPYIEVNKRAFDFYVDFLRTKNKRCLTQAERNMV